MNKHQIIYLLNGFIHQGPRLEPANYSDRASYFSEYRAILRDLHAARELLNAVERRNYIIADHLRQAFKSAFYGRLSLNEEAQELDYCTGQYFPTEYRKAAASVLACALWGGIRDMLRQANFDKGRDEYPTREEMEKQIKLIGLTRNARRFIG